MKTVLCFGDSNTYGSNPVDGSRFDPQTRWPCILRKELGTEWWVIEEGCGGRTTVHDDHVEGNKNGSSYLPDCLNSHKPIDLVILLLGTNDLKERFGVSAVEIAAGVGTLVDLCLNSQAGPCGESPQVLLLAPPPLADMGGTKYELMFKGAEEKAKQLGSEYKKIARLKGCHFLDLDGVVASSPIDGIHWEATEHRRLGRVVADELGKLFSNN